MQVKVSSSNILLRQQRRGCAGGWPWIRFHPEPIDASARIPDIANVSFHRPRRNKVPRPFSRLDADQQGPRYLSHVVQVKLFLAASPLLCCQAGRNVLACEPFPKETCSTFIGHEAGNGSPFRRPGRQAKGAALRVFPGTMRLQFS